MTLPTEETVDKCLEYLLSTAEEFAHLKAGVKGQEYLLRHTRALGMLESSAKSVAAKETEALASESYLQAVKRYEDAIVEYETMAARREAARLKIDVWRSLNAAQRSHV